MGAVAFDTLKFAERLETGGFSTQQARAAAEAFAEATGQELATKRDLSAATAELRQEIHSGEAALKMEIQRVESRLDRLEIAVELVKRDITIRLGAMMMVGFGVLLAALRFMLQGH